MTKSEWCRQNGITKRRFYYWQRKVQEYLLETGMFPQNAASPIPAGSSALIEPPVFCEISEPVAVSPAEYAASEFRADAVIRFGTLSVLINEDTSERTLARLVSVFRSDS